MMFPQRFPCLLFPVLIILHISSSCVPTSTPWLAVKRHIPPIRGAGSAMALRVRGGGEDGLDAELKARLEALVKSEPVMLFMKGSPTAPQCGFSSKIVGLLDKHGVTYGHFDILQDPEVRAGLKTMSNWPTYPQVRSCFSLSQSPRPLLSSSGISRPGCLTPLKEPPVKDCTSTTRSMPRESSWEASTF